MSSSATKQRILESAELLLAENGFGGTSLRALTRVAGVNLAAVNYHFGSKESLFQQVLLNRLDQLNNARIAYLNRIESEAAPSSPSLERILDAFVRPALQMSTGSDTHSYSFIRVLARAYVEQSEVFRDFLSKNYGHVIKRFANAVGHCMPEMPPKILYSRMTFTVGALTYTMADIGKIPRTEDTSEAEHLELVANQLIAFAIAGLRAPMGLPSI